MSKIGTSKFLVQDTDYGKGVHGRRAFWQCPACVDLHAVHLDPCGQPQWAWNGDYLAPTLGPSIRTIYGGRGDCHCFMIAGQIQFCSDTMSGWHSGEVFAGRTVPMIALPAWFYRDYESWSAKRA